MLFSVLKTLKVNAWRKALMAIALFALNTLSSCGSLEQWSEGLQAVGNSLSGANYYMPYAPATKPAASSYINTTQSYITPTRSTSVSVEKEWHYCSQCDGGKCSSCGGTGKYEYAKNGRCGECRGTGKCAGCNGKGGWYI